MKDPHERIQRIDEILGAVASSVLGRGTIAAAGRGLAGAATRLGGAAERTGFNPLSSGGLRSTVRGLKKNPLLGSKTARRAAIAGSRALLKSGILPKAQQLGNYMSQNPLKSGIKAAIRVRVVRGILGGGSRGDSPQKRKTIRQRMRLGSRVRGMGPKR